MAKGQVTLRGRFSPGTVVALVKVRDETVLRAQGGKTLERKKVDKDGVVTFDAEVGARYFITGIQDGFPVQVRARGRAADDPAEVLEGNPVTYERLKLADGSFVDTPPDKVDAKDLPPFDASPNLDQRQIAGDVPQRSATPRGTAHPVDVGESVPYRRQEDVPDEAAQRSDTATGQASVIDDGPQSQEDVPDGVWQRSDTPKGYSTILPTQGPVAAQQEKESSEAKDKRGEPGKAAAYPLGKPKADPKAKKAAEADHKAEAKAEKAEEKAAAKK
jgi:hypothetical protein